MLIHPWEVKNSYFCRRGRKRKQIAFLVASNFVIRPQILIFSVFKIETFPTLIANKIFHVTVLLLVYFCDIFVASEHLKFVRADVTAVFVNNQHAIQRRGQDFDKNFLLEGVHSKEVDSRNFLRQAGQSVMLISC